VTYVPYSSGRMTQLWGEDANEFRPERWLKDGVFIPVSPFKFNAFQVSKRMHQLLHFLNSTQIHIAKAHHSILSFHAIFCQLTLRSKLHVSVEQAGPRICLGKDSAYLQLKMATAILCRFFKFDLVPGHRVKYRTMATLGMENGVKVYVSGRSCTI